MSHNSLPNSDPANTRAADGAMHHKLTADRVQTRRASPTLLEALTTLLGNRLSRSKSDLDIHGRSETHFAPCPPDAVAYPETTAEVSAIMALCHAHDCPVVGWGQGTSLEGHALAIQGGITVDFARMSRVLRVHDADMDAVVQPGITREALNVELRATGLMFTVDPGANASLGGMAATRASGTTSVRYGTMRDNVIAMEVVLANGEVVRTGTRARKSSAGYDLNALILGSEGTLGLITELTVRLHPQPEAISAAVCAFDHMSGAVNAVIDTLQLGMKPARIEVIDALTARALNGYGGTELPEVPHLLVEFHGSHAGVREQAESFGEICRDHNARGFHWADEPGERTALWALRHNAFYAILGLKPGAAVLVTDICVPISKLAVGVKAAQDDLARLGLTGPILGHVGDGNFHSVVLYDAKDTGEVARVTDFTAALARHALRLGGTVTGEHGIGMGKRHLMGDEHGRAWDVMGMIKSALDPKNILNPGKLVPDPGARD